MKRDTSPINRAMAPGDARQPRTNGNELRRLMPARKAPILMPAKRAVIRQFLGAERAARGRVPRLTRDEGEQLRFVRGSQHQQCCVGRSDLRSLPPALSSPPSAPSVSSAVGPFVK